MSVVRADGTPVESFADVEGAAYVPDDPVTVVTERVYRVVPFPGGGGVTRTLLWPAGHVVHQTASDQAFATGEVVRADGSEVADASELATEDYTADDPAYVVTERLYLESPVDGGGEATVRTLLWRVGQVVRQSQADLAFGGPTGSPGDDPVVPIVISATVTAHDPGGGGNVVVSVTLAEVTPERPVTMLIGGYLREDWVTGSEHPDDIELEQPLTSFFVRLTDINSGETSGEVELVLDGADTELTVTVEVSAP